MFGASVSELYLLIKALINIEKTVGLCVITKKKYTHVDLHRTVSQAWRAQTLIVVYRVN